MRRETLRSYCQVVPESFSDPISNPRPAWQNFLSWILYFLFGILLPDGSVPVKEFFCIALMIAFDMKLQNQHSEQFWKACRTFRAIWDIVITTILAFISVALPFSLAFNSDVQWSPDCPERWPGVAASSAESVSLRISPFEALMYAIDGIFAVDILCVACQYQCVKRIVVCWKPGRYFGCSVDPFYSCAGSTSGPHILTMNVTL